MFHKWQLRAGFDTLVIVPLKDLHPPEAATFDAAALAGHVDRWVADPLSRPTVLRIYEYLHGRSPIITQQNDNDLLRRNVIPRLTQAFKRRELVGLPHRRAMIAKTEQALAQVTTQEAAPPRPQKSLGRKTVWVKFRVVEDETDRPLSGVELDIRLPGGETTGRATKSNGLIDIVDIEEPGACTVKSVLKGALLPQTYAFVTMGEKPTKKAKTKGTATSPNGDQEAAKIAIIESHKVKTGETLGALASSCGMSWQDLARFNWGTSDPDEINTHLRDEVGCTKKTADGRSYLFTSEDEPGIVYLPKPWKQDGLATEKTHTIRVKRKGRFLIILENEQKLRIPEAQYEAELADGSKVEGRLGRGGVAAIEDPPPGKVIVEFKDYDDIEAKSLAACARQAFDTHETEEILRVLQHSPQMIKLAVAAYEKYYNDYTGQGLVEDIYQEFTDPLALAVVEGALARAGLQTRGAVEYVAWGKGRTDGN